MVSWQDVRDLGLNLFKKQSRSRTLWIGGSLGIFSLFAWIILLTGVTVDYSGNQFCYENCTAYVNVTSTYWRICFSDNFSLVQTIPEIPIEVYVPTYGKQWRLFDPTKDCIERKNKYNVLPNRFKLVGIKQHNQTIKWNIDRFDVDPKWIGFDYTYEPETIQVMIKENKSFEHPCHKNNDSVYPSECSPCKQFKADYCTITYKVVVVGYEDKVISNAKKRTGITFLGKEYQSPGINVNRAGELIQWTVPIGDRNFIEYGDCREFEEEKGVCTRTDLKVMVK